MLGSRHIWLPMIVAGLLALASVVVPSLHVHALVGPAKRLHAAHAMPGGTAQHGHGGHGSHEEDDAAVPPHCFACRLVAVPGLASFGFARPIPCFAEVPRTFADEPGCGGPAWHPGGARAPPASVLHV